MRTKTFGLAGLATMLCGAVLLSACQPQAVEKAVDVSGAEENQAAENQKGNKVTELQITDVEVGSGATAQAGAGIVVHYTGWLYEPEQTDNKGAKFDSSVDRNQPFEFTLGAGRVIKGWDQGFDGMQVGGKRVLVIPPDMGYGERGAGGAIPPNATLMFEVELLEVR